jgi:hypothetical protein
VCQIRERSRLSAPGTRRCAEPSVPDVPTPPTSLLPQISPLRVVRARTPPGPPLSRKPRDRPVVVLSSAPRPSLSRRHGSPRLKTGSHQLVANVRSVTYRVAGPQYGQFIGAGVPRGVILAIGREAAAESAPALAPTATSRWAVACFRHHGWPTSDLQWAWPTRRPGGRGSGGRGRDRTCDRSDVTRADGASPSLYQHQQFRVHPQRASNPLRSTPFPGTACHGAM